MFQINQINTEAELGKYSIENLTDFLHHHLGVFGDNKESITKSIQYAFSKVEGKGGFILTGTIDDSLVGVVVINQTGMSKFIPENILVYIAVDETRRGQGIGAKLMSEAINKSEGDMALHVEYENPARRLYERLGFKSKYAEMRFNKNV